MVRAAAAERGRARPSLTVAPSRLLSALRCLRRLGRKAKPRARAAGGRQVAGRGGGAGPLCHTSSHAPSPARGPAPPHPHAPPRLSPPAGPSWNPDSAARPTPGFVSPQRQPLPALADPAASFSRGGPLPFESPSHRVCCCPQIVPLNLGCVRLPLPPPAGSPVLCGWGTNLEKHLTKVTLALGRPPVFYIIQSFKLEPDHLSLCINLIG